jgi:hypothetical protein
MRFPFSIAFPKAQIELLCRQDVVQDMARGTMVTAPSELLQHWLRRQISADQYEWLDGRLTALVAEPSDRNLYITFGMIPRRLGKDDLALTPDDFADAQTARPGWNPVGWSNDLAARVLLLCQISGLGDGFAPRFTDLCRGADVGEVLALYAGLPLYAEPDALETQVAEGLRTNMRAEFEAIAHHNPYPREQFDENRWNHMVLKALFIGSALAPIQGLDERANPELARIMCDYAHERWAAGRAVTPELWRCVGPYPHADALADLRRVLETGTEVEQKAAALALNANPAPAAAEMLAGVPTLSAEIAAGALTWQSVANETLGGAIEKTVIMNHEVEIRP